jgi:hypothetical protein
LDCGQRPAGGGNACARCIARRAAYRQTDAAGSDEYRFPPCQQIPRDDEAALAGVQRKLNGIIIPKLEFRETTAAESLAFLEKRSRDLDTAEPDPAKRGVKITNLPSPSQPASDARITISLMNIPLGEAVKYVTNLANLKFRVRAQGVEVAASWPIRIFSWCGSSRWSQRHWAKKG